MSSDLNQTTWRRWTLPLILFVALGLRLLAIDSLGFNSDEAVYSGQGAAIAQDITLTPFFPIFRAHPLLYQFILALVFQFGVNDVLARLVSVIVGVITVYFVYRAGNLLYGFKTGVFAAFILALMPYHVVVTRQVLLDGPMTLFATVTLYLLARFAVSQRGPWLYATGAGLGLTFLAKETGILFTGAIFAFLALSPKVRIRLRDLILSMVVVVLVMIPFPLTLMLAGGGGQEKTRNYLIWQLFRRPNHEWYFYFQTALPMMGIFVVTLALVGLVVFMTRKSWRETLLLSWIIVPVIFFQIWPTKGFQYLLPVAPAVAILAGRTISQWLIPALGRLFRGAVRNSFLEAFVGTVVGITLLFPALGLIYPTSAGSFLAGTGGVPGGKEAGLWVGENVPEGATMMSIGPSMANIIQFYGHRKVYGISVSQNPLHRNPSYQPIRNPDFQLRTGEIQYLIWDTYSANRSSFFSEKINSYAQKYSGRVVHVETIPATTPAGNIISKPAIIIWEVFP